MEDRSQAIAIQEFLRSRRSIRKFTSAPVPDDILLELLKTATYAPSAHGMQPWRFVMVKADAAKSALGQALTSRMQSDMQTENTPSAEIENRVTRSLRRIAEAPLILLICRDTQAVRIPNDNEENLMGIQSVAMTGMQLLLAAHAYGLGGNWICWPLYAQQETIRALNLPENWQPQGMVFLGYPAEEPKEKVLKPISEITKNI